MLELGEHRSSFEEKGGGRRLVFLAIAGVSSMAILGLAILLGAVGFNFRRMSIHEARLTKLVTVGANVDQVTKGLEAEHSPLLMSARSSDQARIAAEQWGKHKRDEIELRAARWTEMRVFRAGDMVYFIFFDGDGKVREFIYVSS
jgi:hypothetical protein